jgi:hypothetical protein
MALANPLSLVQHLSVTLLILELTRIIHFQHKAGIDMN